MAVAAGLAAAVIVRLSWLTSPSWPALLSAALVLILIGVAGDLTESWLKRQANAKDSGTILRGMGGVLDRIDALVFTSIAAVFMLAIGWL